MSKHPRTTERFTPKQGQYLAFIHHYTLIHGQAPAEADMQRYFRTSPPAVHQMVLALSHMRSASPAAEVPCRPRF